MKTIAKGETAIETVMGIGEAGLLRETLSKATCLYDLCAALMRVFRFDTIRDAFLNCFNGDFSGRTLKGTSLKINSDSYLIFNSLKTNSSGPGNTLLRVFLGINGRDNSYTNV